MKLTLERDALHGALGRVGKSVGKPTNRPVLGNFLFRVDDAGLTVVGSDLDMEARETVPARVARDGALTIPARMLVDVVGRSASGCEIAIEQVDPMAPMTLKLGRSRMTLQTLPAADFPEIGQTEATVRFETDGTVLAKLLARTEFAICQDASRFYLNGTFLHGTMIDGAPTLRAVATDGHRLARAAMVAPAGAEAMPGIIIPERAVAEIIRLGKDGGKVLVETNLQHIRVAFQNRTTFVSKLIDGTYPDYERITPIDLRVNTIVDREAFLEGLNRVAAVATAASTTRKEASTIRLGLSRDRLELSTRNPDAGEAIEEIEIDYSGPDFEIGFAPGYMRDTLATLEGDQIRCGFDSPGAAATFESKVRDGLFLILMPRRI